LPTTLSSKPREGYEHAHELLGRKLRETAVRLKCAEHDLTNDFSARLEMLGEVMFKSDPGEADALFWESVQPRLVRAVLTRAVSRVDYYPEAIRRAVEMALSDLSPREMVLVAVFYRSTKSMLNQAILHAGGFGLSDDGACDLADMLPLLGKDICMAMENGRMGWDDLKKHAESRDPRLEILLGAELFMATRIEEVVRDWLVSEVYVHVANAAPEGTSETDLETLLASIEGDGYDARESAGISPS